jgi:hypothetical protein
MTDGVLHFSRELSFIDGFALLSSDQQVGKRFVTGETPDVSGKNATATQIHGHKDKRISDGLHGGNRGWLIPSCIHDPCN